MTIMTTFDKLCYVLVNNVRLLLVRRCSCPIHNVHRKPDDDYDVDVDENMIYGHDDDQAINVSLMMMVWRCSRSIYNVQT